MASNQKSNREPVLELDESEVQVALDALIAKNLIAEVRSGARVSKYQHRFGTSEFAEVRYSEKELAVLCLLFLRGPQTVGELRTRASRLTTFTNVTEVEDVLNKLVAHTAGPAVKKLAREPGKRESRWAHLLGEDSFDQDPQVGEGFIDENSHVKIKAPTNTPTLVARVDTLEAEVTDLKKELTELRQLFDELMS